MAELASKDINSFSLFKSVKREDNLMRNNQNISMLQLLHNTSRISHPSNMISQDGLHSNSNHSFYGIDVDHLNDELYQHQQGFLDFSMTSTTTLFSSNSSTADDAALGVANPPRWLLLALSVIPVWIVFGNLMVLLAVRYHRSLRSLSNYVIASLAFTDFLIAAIVTPLGIYQIVHNQWKLGLYACLVWTGSDVFLSTTSIMHLTAIAIHRYFGISYPLRVRSIGDLRHVACLLVPAWTISLAISIPLIIQGVRNPIGHVFIKDDFNRYQCGIFDRTFAIYSSMVSFFIPLAIMVFADIRSVQILRNNVKLTSKAKSSGATGSIGSTGNNNTCNNNRSQQLPASAPASQRQLQSHQPLIQQHNLQQMDQSHQQKTIKSCSQPTIGSDSCNKYSNNLAGSHSNILIHNNPPTQCNNHFTGLDHSSNRLSTASRAGDHSPSIYELSSDTHSAYFSNSVMDTRVDFRAHSINRSVSNSSETIDDCYIAFSPNGTPSSERDCRIFSPPTTPGGSDRISHKFTQHINNNKRHHHPYHHSNNSRGRGNNKKIGYIGMLSGRGLVKINSRERRAEKTLIWVFVCFVVLWLPFFTTNLTYGICKTCQIPDDLFLAFTWLGYISSGVNPCIYTLLNRDFRNAFKSLLLCRHLKSSRKMNNAAVNSALYN